jgi:CRP-like cAMP-binding protein/rhodanese-related sulfurtransferase
MSDSPVDPNVLATLVPIKMLTPEHCRELATKSELCTFSKAEVIFKQGQKVEKIIYLTSGEVALIMDEEPVKRVKGGSKISKLPLEQGKRYTHSAKALMDVTCIKVDPDELDSMLAWDKSGGSSSSSGIDVQEIEHGEDESDDDWMAKLLQAKIFRRIPPANIQSIFMRLETQHYKADEVVFNQGEEGEHFYIIRQGKARVTRKTRKNPDGMSLAVLEAGDNFGEESLIAGGKRNASVVMETAGVLMSLPKDDFLELLNAPLLKWVNYDEAQSLVTDGAMWIDVRLPAEFKEKHIKGSINIPLPLIRVKMSMLDPDHQYLLYCETGRQSSIATYLLSQEGFETYALQGFLGAVPEAELE